jgi:hypothetical protein
MKEAILDVLDVDKYRKINNTATSTGFDSHTLPPYLFDVSDVTKERGSKGQQ